MEDTSVLDARGLLCPLPVLKAAKRLRALGPGDELRLRADDPAAVIDVPHFCNEQGYQLVETRDEGDAALYVIRKPA
ncbi:MAG: preprotein translocase subunit TatB [Rhodobacterales bacterium]|nr:MAG: preprotein translocase subunit TatB [Rhodobacterales bacterium]